MLKETCLKNKHSFGFILQHFERRIVEVKFQSQNKLLNDLPFESKFNLFMEDLIYFISTKGIQMKWDIDLIIVNNLKELKVNNQDQNNFLNHFKTISNWKVKGNL